jgi:trans-2,3-dihydro-3-hydroxyanthranilate isomerase
MDVSFRFVDVFTEVPFAGNQLCVVPDPPADLSSELMQTIAKEIGFSETTFVTEIRPDGYRVRIFTPSEELPFAGHPTLGTAFTLASEGRITTPCIQTTVGGEVPVDVDLETGFGWMTQFPPAFRDEFDDRELLATACGLHVQDLHPELPAQVVWTGLDWLMVPIRDEATLRRAERNESACTEVAGKSASAGLYLFAVRGDGDVMARMFDPYFGIGEDPATGSAAGPLGAYLSARGLAGMPGRMVVAQGEMVGRPSFVHVDVSAADDAMVVKVGGGVRGIGEGVFRI